MMMVFMALMFNCSGNASSLLHDLCGEINLRDTEITEKRQGFHSGRSAEGYVGKGRPHLISRKYCFNLAGEKPSQ